MTVTDPEIMRFFATIPEASQHVLQASSMGHGGEIFILDMGEPMKIVDLARDLIRLYGCTEEQIRIEFTGLRPGEKLYEELPADEETTTRTPHPKLRIAQARGVPGQSARRTTAVADAASRVDGRQSAPRSAPLGRRISADASRSAAAQRAAATGQAGFDVMKKAPRRLF